MERERADTVPERPIPFFRPQGYRDDGGALGAARR